MTAHRPFTPALRESFERNRAAIRAARAEADAKIAAAARSDMSWEDLGRELRRIDAERLAKKGAALPESTDSAPYDPVYDYTAASHSYFGRL